MPPERVCVYFHAFTRFRHFTASSIAPRLFKRLSFAHVLMQHQRFHQLLTDAHIGIQQSLGPEKSLNLFSAQFIDSCSGKLSFHPLVARSANTSVGSQQALSANAVAIYPNQTHLQYPAFLRHVGKIQIIDRRDVAVGYCTKRWYANLSFSGASACCCETAQCSFNCIMAALTNDLSGRGITQAIADELKQNSVTTGIRWEQQ